MISAQPLVVGSIVADRYEIEKPLTLGEFVSSYLCRDHGAAKAPVRMKVLQPVSSPPDSMSRELSLLRRLRHPVLNRLMDFGVLEGTGDLYLVDEWFDGTDLFAGTRGMDGRAVLDLVVELAEALQYLHARGISHGALGISNTLLSRDEKSVILKLMNTGLARCLPESARGEGLLAYMAPEVLMGGAASERSDLYSLGVLMYQLLTRRLPFEDEDPGFLIQKHLQVTVDLRPIERTAGGAAASRLICGLLDKNPSKRPSCRQILATMREELGGRTDPDKAKGVEGRFSSSHFVGRESQILLLQQRAERVRSGRRGWTVFIKGEAGSGKTRLMEELRDWAALRGWRAVEGTCGSHEKGPYGPYRQILENTRPPDGKTIFQFSDLPRATDSGAFDSSSEFAAGQFRDLLTRELVRRLTRGPTLLLLHDFHLADEATCTVLDYLSSDIKAHPILMCVSLRSGEESRTALNRVMDLALRQERGEVMEMEPLTEEEVKRLVAGVTGESEIRETLGNWIFRSIGGNPFFVEEMLKHLCEQGLLRWEADCWRFMDRDLGKLEVPASVGVVLRKRLSHLPGPATELASWMAVFHRPIANSLLGAITSWADPVLSHSLDELRVRQMIRQEMREGEQTVEFCHPIIAEVIRGGLPQRVRRRMHGRIAEVLEREFGAEGRLQEIALHSMEGDTGAAAVRHALALALQSRAQFAHEQALHCFRYVIDKRGDLTQDELCQAVIQASDTMLALGMPELAIKVLKKQLRGVCEISSEARVGILVQLATSYRHLGDFSFHEKFCKKGLQYSRCDLSGKERNRSLAVFRAELAFGSILQSKPKRGLSFLRKAISSCLGEGILEARIQNLAASIYRVVCDLHRAKAASNKASSILTDWRESHLACSVCSTLGIVLMGLGRFHLALEKHKTAVQLSERIRSVVLKSQAFGNIAECLCRMGHIKEAILAAEKAMGCVSDSNNPSIDYAFKAILAEVRLSSFRPIETLHLISQLQKNIEHKAALYVSGHVHYIAASAYFCLGDFDAALRHVDDLRDSQSKEAPFYESELSEALRARILSERGDSEKAVEQLETLAREVTKKRWPYHMCLIKLHLAEVLIRKKMMAEAAKPARDALRLALGMQSDSLAGHSRLLIGKIRAASGDLANGIGELQSAVATVDPSFPNEIACRAHADLAAAYLELHDTIRSLEHAEKGYACMCALENLVPTELLPLYRNSFERDRIKSDLLRIIGECRPAASSKDANTGAGDLQDEDKSRILLRMSAVVNSSFDLDRLLDEISDQLIRAVDVERVFVFLKDATPGRLLVAKGRNNHRECLTAVDRGIMGIAEEVCRQVNPIVSLNARGDSRLQVPGVNGCLDMGKLLCAPLRLSGRVTGVLYADHSSAAETLSESVINLFAAFCNLAAIAIENALVQEQLVREKLELEQYLHHARDPYDEIVGGSAAVEELRDRIGLAAASPLDILVTGESGTGKELVARAIHRTGRRQKGPFVPVDCGALADSIVEAELFGYRKGAFTGASENREGLLEAADGGILFLDEVSNMPFQLQAKLLRVLQEREVRRIGETGTRRIDVQVIAATNKDLLEESGKGGFRKDLYYRLKAMEIRVPPLRDRLEDVPLLLQFFLDQAIRKENGRLKSFSPEAKILLRQYRYPGNIRELRNIVLEAYYSAKTSIIEAGNLPPEVSRKDVLETSADPGIAGRIYADIAEGRGSFEELVKTPFLHHRLGITTVRGVLEKALRDSGGRYREAFARLRIPGRHYSMMMRFLKRNDCYLDFRPFRQSSKDPTEMT